MTFPLNKYKYYRNGNMIIAVSTYAGRKIRGVAKCHPDEKFDLERGKLLAAARCNQKIASKRLNRAQKKATEAAKEYQRATINYRKMIDYKFDALQALEIANIEVKNISNS